MKVFSILFKY